jgi:hypothetical protein
MRSHAVSFHIFTKKNNNYDEFLKFNKNKKSVSIAFFKKFRKNLSKFKVFEKKFEYAAMQFLKSTQKTPVIKISAR